LIGVPNDATAGHAPLWGLGHRGDTHATQIDLN
jgi:hypothetical protein